MPVVAETIHEFRNESVHIREQLIGVHTKLNNVLDKIPQQDTSISIRQHISNAFADAATALGVARPTTIDTQPSATTQTPIHPTASLPTPPEQTERSQPQYGRMSRQLYTVHHAWKEYVEGIDGGPSIRALEEEHGTRWRMNSSDSKFFMRRKPLYDCIQILQSQGFIENDAVAYLENLKGPNRSLRSLCDLLKRALSTYKDGSFVNFMECIES